MLAAAIAAAACGGTTTDGKDASVDAKDDYMAAPPYGAPAYGIVPVDGGLDSGRDSGPVDSGVDAPKDASDEG